MRLLPALFLIANMGLQAQNPLPGWRAGDIPDDQLYGLRQWTVEEVQAMPKAIRPAWQAGGVLVDENQFHTVEDSIQVVDYSNVPPQHLTPDTIPIPGWKRTLHHWELGLPYPAEYLFYDLLLQDSLADSSRISLFIIRPNPYPLPAIIHHQPKEGYRTAYLDLPKKWVKFTAIRKKPPFWLSWEEWEEYKQGKAWEQQGELLVAGDYLTAWPFPPGYYDSWEKMVMERNSDDLIAQIQAALLERGYEVEVNNIFDAPTKAALAKFQRDNGLPVCMGSGQMILQALGLE